MNTCHNCGHKYEGNFCPECGTPVEPKRITSAYLAGEFAKVINVERGLIYTVKELAIRPGVTVRNFITKDRRKLMKPIIFLILTSFIYSFSQNILKFEDAYINAEGVDSTVTQIFKWIQNNYGYANLFMGVFIGVWMKIFFRKSGYNLYEMLVLIFYLMGMGMLMYMVFGLFQYFTGIQAFLYGAIIALVYTIWGIASFIDGKKRGNYSKAIFAYFIGWITSIIILTVTGLLIDYLLK